MDDNVKRLFPAHDRMTVEQAIGVMQDYKDKLSDVIVIGVHNTGGLLILGSHMPREYGFWLLELGKQYILQNALKDE